MNNQLGIKWISIQPLTGGMYLGFRKIFGNDAECIISYKGLNTYTEIKRKEHSTDLRGKCGNEYNLSKYLSDKGWVVPRFEFADANSLMDNLYNEDGEIILENTLGGKYNAATMFNDDIDVVCAVPICSGLSTLTTADNETRECRNNNMFNILDFVVKFIKPKVYIFENAPQLLSSRGEDVRLTIQQIAIDNNYSVTYFKTDSKFHYNCQRRVRSFVMLVRNDFNLGTPLFDNYEHVTLTPKEMFESISENAQYNCSFPKPLFENVISMNWAVAKFPDTWRELFKRDFITELRKRDLVNDFIEYCEQVNDAMSIKMINYVNKILNCLDENKGWWIKTPKSYDDLMPAVQSKTLFSTIHPYEDRLLSEREHMKLMGLPDDFNMQGNFNTCCRQISQNVPVNTAAWMARTAYEVLKNWNDKDKYSGYLVSCYDNTTMTEIESFRR